MNVREQVWRWLLVTRPTDRWTLGTVAQAVNRSEAVVRRALAIPLKSGAIARSDHGWRVIHRQKLLMIWAVFHEWDVLGTLTLRAPVREIEGYMLPDAFWTGPSALRFRGQTLPADYDQVWVYLPEAQWPLLVERFRPLLAPEPVQRRSTANLWVLRPDAALTNPVPWPQVFVDLWQSSRWWSAEFCRVVEGYVDGA